MGGSSWISAAADRGTDAGRAVRATGTARKPTGAPFGVVALLAMLVSRYVGVFMLLSAGPAHHRPARLLMTGVAIVGGIKPCTTR